MSASDSSPLSDDVLDRYLAGQSSRAERDLVARWIGDDPDRTQWIRAIATQSRSMAQPAPLDIDAMTARLEARLAAEMTAPAARSASSDMNVPIRAQGGVVLRRHRWLIATALAGAAAAVLITITPFLTQRSQSEPAMREIVTRVGERAKLQLSDGTRVTVGPNTRLRYPTVFAKDRTVLLERGIAFFDVTHDPAHPFAVRTPTAIAQDLGTAFSVSANARDSVVRVIVSDGRVSLRSSTELSSRAALLSRGDLAVLRGVGASVQLTVRRSVDVTRAMAWIDGRLTFTSTPLRDVIAELEQWYDVDIGVRDSTLLNEGITGTFDGESVHDILAQLSVVSDLQVEQLGHRVMLKRAPSR